MRIKDIKVGRITIPLRQPFKTATTTINEVNEVVVKIIADSGEVGIGSAVPSAQITGDSQKSIIDAVNLIKLKLYGMDIDNLEEIMSIIDNTISGNTSAKAALDMAVYDLFGKKYNIPLYKLFGGSKGQIITDITINIGTPEEMVKESLQAINNGFKHLKIKVGTDPILDFKRVKTIRQAVRKDIKIRVDADQGWTPKSAVKIITKFEDAGLDIELIEQPVKAWDLEGLKFVTDNVMTDILADESVHSSRDALKIMQMRAADLINIKLMKCGGFHNALKICSIAETMGIECMMGCMVESKIGITAAANFAMGKKNIVKTDLDMVLSFENDPVIGGAKFEENMIIANEGAGLGIKDVIGLEEII
ncbi:dipeptide epimerase [Clostridium ganghwense]|uniref:Dipeptide epimerase n=1 Tax=Clostridium ganghwense TaxID=312089 RepID=A0ABT4CQ80_9CLOT|nr:dipeptide epimerase [Clostridium ganghwense]MCY6371205.1 dipeptide epimerase [Clostridium ganghwense]